MIRIIDLSLTFKAGMRGVTFEPDARYAVKRYNTTILHLNSHSGTHMDAPLHFIDGGMPIDQVDVRKCMGRALVIDVTHVPPLGIMTVADLGAAAEQVTPGSRLLLRSDWSKRADEEDYRTAFPRIGLALAEWLASKPIALLGVETPSVASMLPENREELISVHQALLREEIVIVESLANLDELRQPEVQFFALPLRLDGVDGSPVRALAIEDVP